MGRKAISAKRAALGLFITALAGFSAASMAWSCTFQPRIFGLSQQAGPKGSEVTVTGQGVAPQGIVEIHWNGVTGPKLAETSADGSGNFSVLAIVPDVPPDVYSLIAVAGEAGVARSSFEVTPLHAMSAPADGGQAQSVAEVARDTRAFWPSGPERGSLHSVPASSNSNDGMKAGVALLAGGLVTLFSGFAIVLVRKRRALAGAE